MRAARDGQPLTAKTYTRLFIDGRLWMTDAEFEIYTNQDFVNRAFGHVLIAGLGLGLIIEPLLKQSDVASVTVLERSADVIALIGPLYDNPKLTIVEADVHTWEPPAKKYHFVYFDIWPDVPNSDQAAEIAALKKRYRKSLAVGGRTSAWCERNTRERRY